MRIYSLELRKKIKENKQKKVFKLPTVRTLAREGIFDVKQFDSYVDKLKGLEFMEPNGYTYYFFNCYSIHTFGMKHKLDVAFVTDGATVSEVHRNVGPNRILTNRNADGVYERFASDEPWFVEGEVVVPNLDQELELGLLSDEELSRVPR